MDQTTFEVSEAQATLEVGTYDVEKKSFEVTVKGISCKSGIKEVLVPVWSKANQSDLVWHETKKQSDGSYKVTIKVPSDIKNAKYNVHAYVTGKTEFSLV